VCVAMPGRDYNLPTRVGIPTLYLVATFSFLVVRVSRFAWLLSARDHYPDPAVLSGGGVTSAYVDVHAPGSGRGWDTLFLGFGSAPADAGGRGWAWWFLPGDNDRQDRDAETRGGRHRHVQGQAGVDPDSS